MSTNALSKSTNNAIALFVLSGAMAVPALAQTVTILASFNLNGGLAPIPSGLIQSTNGAFYGTTTQYATNTYGSVFDVTTSGLLSTIYSPKSCTKGCDPWAGLVLGTNGDLYGVDNEGGPSGANCYGAGCGAIYRITSGGATGILHNFNGTDGSYPIALIQATNGNFYGVTHYGGSNTLDCSNGCGTFFKMSPTGTVTTLYNFCSQPSCADGDGPRSLLQASDGNFYGITQFGGTASGTLFKLTPSGSLTTLYNFCSQTGCVDLPNALIQAADGYLYGTSLYGGTHVDYLNSPAGTVFKVSTSGALTVLYNFCAVSGCFDGDHPEAGLVQGTDGNLYGTTSSGGIYDTNYGGAGTIFKITTSGTLTTLYSFCAEVNCADGTSPWAPLVQGTDGNFYGTSEQTVFRLAAGLGPFVRTLPTVGKVGAAVKILGTSLTGATSVTFNGIAAAFSIVSATEITTTVPTGATSGVVQVVTPGGTLASNVAFKVH